MLHRIGALVALGALASGLSPIAAQSQAPEIGSIVEGRLPGTQRWIVHFHTRSFDLAAFRDARRARRPAAEVNAIVRDLEQKAIADQRAFVAAVEKLGGAIVSQWWLINAAAIDIDPARLDAVRSLPNVARLEADRVTEPAILTATNASNHNSDALNTAGYTGLNVTTAIMDTGQDSNMAGTGRPHRTYFVNGDPTNLTGGGIGGSRLVTNTQMGTQPADDVHGHGTGVASISAGAIWLNAGADFGHAPRAKIAGYSISNNTAGSSDLTTMANTWQRIATDAATYNTVSANNSYSGSPSPLSAEQQALDACAVNADILICVAAANSGSSTAVSQSGANGLAVAAVNANTHTVASFSSRGPLSGDAARFYPDISACGVSTVMALRDNESGNYTASGTSMASPQVCGAATLLRAANPALSALETKAILLASARDISAQNPVAPYNTRNAYGMGLLRDDDAMTLALDAQRHGEGTVSTSSTTWSTTFNATSGQLVQAAITWHRNNTTITTWANLDLQVYNGATLVAQSNTTRNLYEMVRFNAPATATYELRVVAVGFETGLTAEDFGYALTHDVIVSGTVSPAGYLTTEGNAAFFFWGPQRRLMGIDRTNVGGPQTWSRAAWRRDGTSAANAGYGPRTFDLTMRMGHSGFAVLHTRFDANYLVPATTVYTTKPTNFPDWTNPPTTPPAAFDFEIPFDVPFNYAGTRALIWDIDMNNSTNTAIVPLDRQYVGVTQTTGTAAGTGCISTGQATPFSHTMFLQNGGAATNPAGMTLGFGGTFAPAGAPMFLSLDVVASNVSVPFLCTAIRAMPTVVLSLGAADASGTFTERSLAFAYNASVQGGTFATQLIALDAGQPTPFLALSLSNGRSAIMPGPSTGSLPACYLWASGTAPTGTVFLGGAPIVRLR